MPGAPTCSVLHLLSQILKTQGFYTIRYNSRGVGGSSGWRSLTGLQEGLDLQEVVQWALSYIADIRHVLIVVSTQLLLMCPKMNFRLLIDNSVRAILMVPSSPPSIQYFSIPFEHHTFFSLTRSIREPFSRSFAQTRTQKR